MLLELLTIMQKFDIIKCQMVFCWADRCVKKNSEDFISTNKMSVDKEFVLCVP